MPNVGVANLFVKQAPVKKNPDVILELIFKDSFRIFNISQLATNGSILMKERMIKIITSMA